MVYYEIYGKWYHLSYSEYFKHVVRASSARAALFKLARCLSGEEDNRELSWNASAPKQVIIGQQEPEPTFWVGDDQMYQVRTITIVKPQVIECLHCEGTGKVKGFVPVESAY